MRARGHRPAPSRSSPECLFLGPVRCVKDEKTGQFIIQTAEDHPQGFRIEIARLSAASMAEARAIVALSDLLKAAPPFAALGRHLAELDPAEPLFAAAKIDITAGHAQAMTAAQDRALGPASAFRGAGGAAPATGPRAANKP